MWFQTKFRPFQVDMSILPMSNIVNVEIACLLSIKGIMQILFFIGETIGDVFLDLYLDPLAYFFAFGASP